jgi:hypothetical protein
MVVVITMAVCAFAWSTYDSIMSENAFQLLLSFPTMIMAGLGLTCLTVSGPRAGAAAAAAQARRARCAAVAAWTTAAWPPVGPASHPPPPTRPARPPARPQLKWYSPATVGSASGYSIATAAVVVMVLANAWLGYLTWHQFGWRMHSRFGCDLRRKQAARKLQLFFVTNRFRSLLKADVQFLLLVCANGVVIAIGRLLEQDEQRLEDGRGICIGMLVCCFAGLLLQYAWVRVCQAAVHTLDRSLEALATVTVGALPSRAPGCCCCCCSTAHLAARSCILARPTPSRRRGCASASACARACAH